MTWLAPLAFLGLAAVAVPILVHLFGRPRARLVRVPSLRFIELTRDAPRRRAMPSDWLLLAIRTAIVALAVAALARPTWPGLGGETDSSGIVRTVIVDTSASMQRRTAAGETALAAARRMAGTLNDGSAEAIVIETAWPALALDGAAAWIARRTGEREIVVISDFQAGVLAPDDTARVPRDVGLRPMRITPDAGDGVAMATASAGTAAVEVRAVRAGAGTRATWTFARGVDTAGALVILAGPEHRAAAEAVARAVSATERRPGRRAIIVLPDAPGRDSLLRLVREPAAPWQGTALLRLAREPSLRDADGAPPASDPGANLVPFGGGGHAGVVDDGTVAVFAGRAADPVSWGVIAAATARILAPAADLAEQDPAFVPDETIRALERPATRSGLPSVPQTASRWIWLGVLLLLGVEWIVRRGRPATAVVAPPHARYDHAA